MRRGRLPLTALRAFEAAGRAESISLAAAELHVSQAAVSRQIKELEAQIGIMLFERIHRGVRLTPQGQHLLLALTQAFDGIADALGDISSPKLETILISSEPGFAACWLAPKLFAFQEIAPNVDVVLNAESQMVDFGNDGTTLAIRFARERSSWARVEVRKLCDTRLSAYLSPALAASIDISTPASLLALSRLHEDNRDDWCHWFAAAGVKVAQVERGTMFNDSAVMLQAALNGQGVVLLDDLFDKSVVETGDLVRPFDISIVGGSYWLASRSFDRLSENAKCCADWIMKTVAAETDLVVQGSN
ncbi:LysR substrate-binding domain-containing protein [Roseovarius sp. Pro17]|uniref:LysR substrate-binding domain-containing protein n=1 Tax=Roseovarius sp. Pro17 TaxID=3108175 RepID=UPI002D7789A1|nr:LysR substrate-binding domain-containing protein [Roseovarius sp. Pro17]